MGVAYNNRIVTDGLVLALDAGNNKSHSTNRFISYGSGLVTEAVNFSNQALTGFQRVAAGTVIGGYTVKTTDVVYSYALGVTGGHYHGNTAPIPAGVSATFTFDYLVTGATTYPINDYLANFENYGGGALSAAIATANSLQNVWQRRSFTAGPTSSAGTQAMFLYPGASGRLADSGTIYFRNPRVEFTSVDTGTGNFSSMSNLTTWYDLNNGINNGTLTNTPYHLITDDTTGTCGYMSFEGTDDYILLNNINVGNFGTSNFTVSVWCKTAAGSTGSRGVISKYEPHSGNGSGWFMFNNDGQILTRITQDISAPLESSEITASVSANIWYNFTIKRDANKFSLFINGQLYQENTTTNVINCSNSSSILSIGAGYRYTNGATGYYYLGNIGSTQIYNRALTAAEIRQNYNAMRARFVADGSSPERAAPNAAHLVSLGITRDGNYWYKPSSYSGSAVQLYTNFSNAPSGKGYVLVARGRESTDWWNTNGQNTGALTSSSLNVNTPIAVLPSTFVNGLIGGNWNTMKFLTNRVNGADSWLFTGTTSATFSWTYFPQNGTTVSASAQKYNGLWLTGGLALNWSTGIYWTDTLNYGGGNNCDRTFTWSWGGHGVYQGWSGGSTCTPAGSFVNTNEGHAIQLVNCYVEC